MEIGFGGPKLGHEIFSSPSRIYPSPRDIVTMHHSWGRNTRVHGRSHSRPVGPLHSTERHLLIQPTRTADRKRSETDSGIHGDGPAVIVLTDKCHSPIRERTQRWLGQDSYS